LAITVGDVDGTVENAAIDGGGKRVALILDASRKVPKDEWKLETEMALSLIGHARPEDRFGIFVTGVDSPTGPLLPAEGARKQLGKLVSARPDASDESERIYDALLMATERLDPPAFGDAVFLFGHAEDSSSNASPEQIQEIILKRGLRFYAMSFTDPLKGKLPPGFNLNNPLPATVGPEPADKISHATGYYFSFHSVDDLKVSGQKKLLKRFLGDLYAGIAEPYRVKISANVADKTALNFVIRKAQARNIRQSDMHYPRYIYPCPAW
jgi:hypothetical protein